MYNLIAIIISVYYNTLGLEITTSIEYKSIAFIVSLLYNILYIIYN